MKNSLLNISKFIVIALSFLCVNGFANAEPASKAHKKLTQYLDNLQAHEKLMGTVYITKKGEPLYEHHFGYASVKDKRAIDANTAFRIASISKIYTSVLLMQLVEAGKLTLDTTLEGFYPTLPKAESITIEHLLTHRSGIYNYIEDLNFHAYKEGGQTREEMEQRIIAFDSQFKPDSKHAYSNSNYLLLGYIIESLYGKSYAEVVAEKIAKPLGLISTYVPSDAKLRSNEATGYHFPLPNTQSSGGYQMPKGWQKNVNSHPSVLHAAGGIVSTAKETNQFLVALSTGKLVSEKSLNEMKKLRDGYGLGMFAAPFYHRKFYGHNGFIDGYMSSTGYNFDDGIALTVVSNAVNFNFNDMLIAVLSSVYDYEFEIPDFSLQPIVATNELLKKVSGKYSSKDLPLVITMFAQGMQVMAQATGQGPIPITPYSQSEFRFAPAGIVVKFDESSMSDGKYTRFTLLQNGGTFKYQRD